MIEFATNLLLHYKYLLILPLAIIEGPVISLICGFFLRLGYFSFTPIFILLMLGDIASDIYWYAIGYFGGRKFILKFGKYVGLNETKLAVVEKIYHKHLVLILFLSKITMGFGFAIAVVATAGIAKVPFKKYLAVNILGQPIWTGILLGAGYFLGEFYTKFNQGIEILYFFAAIVIGMALLIGLSNYIKKEIFKRTL